ncbi:MAG: hypothetical protein HZA91_09705 [Verrucomicrobia bacterium]|nr:hypothetical protein [Verrucomicrobiota bacterium]
MRKALAIGGVICLFATCALLWLTLPWASHIEKRVSTIGPAKITEGFDAWLRTRKKNEAEIPVDSLPSALRDLRPVRVHLDQDGLYLVLKIRFVEEDGVFIALPVTGRKFDSGSDPSYYPLGGRVYRYHISG